MTAILDLRAESLRVPLAQRPPDFARIRRGAITWRAPVEVDSIVLHQSACVWGPLADPAKRHRRALQVPAHAVAYRDGTAVLPHPLPWWLWHAQGLSRRSLGLEVEGRYPGCPDDPETPQREDAASTWGERTPLDELTVETARVALTTLVEQAAAWGAPIRYVLAHRQSSPMRAADPGYELWRAVALDCGVGVLGLQSLPDLAIGKGRPIPREWDSERGVGAY